MYTNVYGLNILDMTLIILVIYIILSKLKSKFWSTCFPNIGPDQNVPILPLFLWFDLAVVKCPLPSHFNISNVLR